MKATLKGKSSIQSIVEPIESASKIYTGLGLDPAFVQEFDADSIHVCCVDEDNTIFVTYRLNTANIFDSYEVKKDKIGIYDTAQFTKLFKKYMKFYNEDQKVSIDYEDGKYCLTYGQEKDIFHTCSITQVRRGNRGFDTSAMSCLAKFQLEGDNLSKILTNIGIYAQQTTVTFNGSAEGSHIQCLISSPDKEYQNYGSFYIEGIEIETDFTIRFAKNKIKGVLECNDKFDVALYSVKKGPCLGHFTYSKNDYDMNFYLAPNKST
jgi:hypothetical protein